MSMLDFSINPSSIALPPTREDSVFLVEHFNAIHARRREHLEAFLSMPGQNLAQYSVKSELNYNDYQWLSKQIGGGNYANT